LSETEPGCPFCNPLPGEIVLRNELAYVRRDRFPVAKGHVLAIPFRHVPSFFDTTPEERSALLDLIVQVKVLIDEEHHPDGYNIGVNVGSSAGQAVMHVHFHVIPRYRRDTKGHHGGIRWVIPRGSSTPGEELVRVKGRFLRTLLATYIAPARFLTKPRGRTPPDGGLLQVGF
jgi:diadenosine tetraphosphate (Ap4A) HIT family hydrolase